MYLAEQNKALVTIFHVFFVVVGMGSALVTDLLFVYFALNKTLAPFETKVIRLLSRAVTFALCGILLSGFFLFLSDTERYLGSAKFLTKMTVVATLVVNGFLLHTLVFKHLSDQGYLNKAANRSNRRKAFLLGAISFVSWVSAMSLGVLDKIPVSYTTALSIYLAILGCGALASQVLHGMYENMRRK